MKAVGQPIRKKDAMALVTGKPVFMDDLAPKDCLIVKVLRSPHANAIVKSVKTDVAKRVPGIEDVYTWEDVPQERFTTAGQTSRMCIRTIQARLSIISRRFISIRLIQ